MCGTHGFGAMLRWCAAPCAIAATVILERDRQVVEKFLLRRWRGCASRHGRAPLRRRQHGDDEKLAESKSVSSRTGWREAHPYRQWVTTFPQPLRYWLAAN